MSKWPYHAFEDGAEKRLNLLLKEGLVRVGMVITSSEISARSQSKERVPRAAGRRTDML